MLVDANVFKGYFQVELGMAHALCGCPAILMKDIRPDAPVYHDDGRIIEHEWRSVVDRDWFDAWLSASLQSGAVQYVRPTRDQSVEKKLKALGFPSGRDIIYVRTGLALVAKQSPCTFYTEDLDFYDPKLKGRNATKRLQALKNSSGPVAKQLRKAGLLVKCVP